MMSRSTVKPDLIATEMLAFPSNSSRNKHDSDLTIGILGIISIANSNNSDHFLSLSNPVL